MLVIGILLGGLFGLILLGLPLGFSIAFVSVGVLKFMANLPLWVFMQRFFAGLDSFVLVAIPFFLLTGNIMNRGNITNKLINLAYSFVGHIKGGLAQVTVMGCMLFGGISGSGVADVSGIGSVMIPSMVKKGYPVPFTVALTSTASTLGQIIPPSIIMIIYAATAGTSVGALFLAGVIPGIIIGVGLMILSYIYAIKYNLSSSEHQNLGQIWKSVKDAILTLGAPLIIIGGIVLGIFTATEASVIAVLYCFFLSVVVYKTLSIKEIPDILLETAKMSALILFCIGGSAMFGWLMGYFQVTDTLIKMLTSISNSSSTFILIVIGLFLVLGTFMDAVPAIIIFVPIVTPIANALGIHPIHLGLIICCTLAFGLVTPPYGLCLLLASSIAKVPANITFKDLAICLTVVIVALLIISFFPDIILFLPRVLMPNFV